MQVFSIKYSLPSTLRLFKSNTDISGFFLVIFLSRQENITLGNTSKELFCDLERWFSFMHQMSKNYFLRQRERFKKGVEDKGPKDTFIFPACIIDDQILTIQSNRLLSLYNDVIGFSKCGDLPNIYNAKFNYMSLKSTSCHTIYVNNDALVAQSERVSLMWEGVLGIALRLSK